MNAPSQTHAANITPTLGINPWFIAISVMLATFMEVLDTSVANVALPHIAGNLSASTEESIWVLTSYLISNAIILPATGWFSRYFGRKKFLISCVIIFTISSALCGAASSLGFLIVARIIQGIGGGALQPISQAILLESFPAEKRGTAMAVFALGVIVAPIIGPTLGGWLTDNYSWRWIFYINVPIGVLSVLMIQSFIEDPSYLAATKDQRIDFLGFGLLILWLAAFQIILDKGESLDWFDSGTIRSLFVTMVAGLVGFIVWEIRSKNPIVNLKVFLNRNFTVGTILMTVTGAVLYGSTAILPLFLQNLMHYPSLNAGLAISPRGLGAIVMTTIVAKLVGLIDNRFLIAIGFFVLAFSSSLLAGVNLQISTTTILWPVVINGIAIAFIFVPLTSLTMGTLENEEIGNATGIFNLMRNIGGSIGISVLITMISRGAQIHQASLISHLSSYNPVLQEKLQTVQSFFTTSVGSVTASKLAYAGIYVELVRQSNLLAFVDNFRGVSLICLACVPLAFVFRKVKAREDLMEIH